MNMVSGSQRDKILQVLNTCSFFDNFSEEELDIFLEYGRFVRCQATTCVLQENQFDSNFYVVVGGQVSAYAGRTHLTDLGPGDFFGEMGTVTGEATNTSIVAKKDSIVLKLEATVTEAGGCEFQRKLYRTMCEVMIARLGKRGQEAALRAAAGI